MKGIFARTLAAAALALAAGCASFEAERRSRFVDENRRFIHVEYGRDEKAHETTFTTPTGVRLPFKSGLKVRVTTPDGKTFTAYRNMSVAGVLYKTDDGKWEYFEEGTGCALAELAPDGSGYILRFQGVMCATERNPDYEPKRPKIRSSSIPVINSPGNTSAKGADGGAK